jgi:hypothetical protein
MAMDAPVGVTHAPSPDVRCGGTPSPTSPGRKPGDTKPNKPRAEARGHRVFVRDRSALGAGRRGTRSPPASAGGFYHNQARAGTVYVSPGDCFKRSVTRG